jgi:hypothetical protein
MSTLREAAQQALEALEDYERHTGFRSTATDALRAALAQQEQEHEQEPVAWGLQNDEGQVFDCIAPGSRLELSEYNVPLYTHPPRRETEQEQEPVTDLRCAFWLDPECADAGACQSLKFKANPPRREWRSLSEEEINALWASHDKTGEQITRAIEAALKERNT